MSDLRSELRWALDLLDLYDERLAQIDGPASVYTPTHVAAKASCRALLVERCDCGAGLVAAEIEAGVCRTCENADSLDTEP